MPLAIRWEKWKFVVTIFTFSHVWEVARREKSKIKFNAFTFHIAQNVTSWKETFRNVEEQGVMKSLKLNLSRSLSATFGRITLRKMTC